MPEKERIHNRRQKNEHEEAHGIHVRHASTIHPLYSSTRLPSLTPSEHKPIRVSELLFHVPVLRITLPTNSHQLLVVVNPLPAHRTHRSLLVQPRVDAHRVKDMPARQTLHLLALFNGVQTDGTLHGVLRVGLHLAAHHPHTQNSRRVEHFHLKRGRHAKQRLLQAVVVDAEEDADEDEGGVGDDEQLEWRRDERATIRKERP